MPDSPTSDNSQPPDLTEAARSVLAFAHERLGPACEQVLANPTCQARILSVHRGGVRLEDAILRELHRQAREDRSVANEFLAFFLEDMLKLGRPLISTGLRRFLDTGDLVQSVLGDIWSELAAVRFDNRASFLSLLVQRLSWKASDKARGLKRARRREDLRLAYPPEDLELASQARSPLSFAARSEERERLVLAMLRLSERDQKLLRMHFKGATLSEIAEALDLSNESARKALYRAIRRARDLVRPPDIQEPDAKLQDATPERAGDNGPRNEASS